MCRVLGKDNTDSVRWWIDASYAVHPSMHGHTGATMSMGNGSVYSRSWKQKMVMRSSTESEVVGVYDVLPQILWTKKFLEDQGVTIKETVLYQDNMSSMLLEQNGRQLSTKRTKHMDIRYFYVGDHIQNKTLSLRHCPTKEMLADYFTKPLQGSLFIRLRNHIMGAEFEDGDPQTPRSVLEYQETRKHPNGTRKHPNGTRRHPNGTRMKWKIPTRKFSPRDQNDENACVTNTQHDKHTRKKEQQVTYREALLGLDNSELGSDF